jgi:hypothetical protein
VGSGVATAALDLASLLRWALAPPHVPHLWSLPSCWGEFRHCHVSLSSDHCLLAEVSSGVATCPWASGSAFLRRELRCCHVSHGPRWAVDRRNKERLNRARHADRFVYFQGTLVRYRSACKTCRLLQCSPIVQHRPNWPLLDMTTMVIWPDMTTVVSSCQVISSL